MQIHADILSEDEIQRVHQQSLRILNEVGVRFYSRKSLQILSDNGASVDWEKEIARIPPELVEHALQSAPKSFRLGARNPAQSFQLPSQFSRYGMDGTAAFAIDFETGERRYGNRKDIEYAMRIFQQLDMGVLAWAPTCASDAPAHSRALHEFFAMVKYCSKHGQHELHTVEQVPYLVEGLVAIEGSESALRENRNYSLIYCPVAPLSHDGPMLEAYLELGEHDMPVMVMPMPVCGSTGPASLFANVCLANAEMLSALVVYQLARPGRPIIYSSATGTMDFMSGAFIGGSPEMGIQSAALTVMGRHYDLPSTCAGCTSDARQPGPEAVLEKLISMMAPVLAGADIIIGMGEIEGDQTLVLEQLIVDNELAHLCERLVQGVDSSPEKDLIGDIFQVGPGGHFLKCKSTRAAARSQEFFTPKLIARHSYETWRELGSPTMYAKARERVQEILAGPLVDPLPEEICRQLDEILLTADQKLAPS
mgnify:CR=1 FL=1